MRTVRNLGRESLSQIFLCIVVSLTALAVTASASAQEPILDATAAGSAVLAETVVGSLALLADNVRCDPQAMVSYDGRVTVNEGWRAQLQGTYAASPLTFSYSSRAAGAFFDTSGSGSLGDMPWTLDSDRSSLNAGDATSAVLLQTALSRFSDAEQHGRHLQKRWAKAANAMLRALGTHTTTLNGIPIQMWQQDSVWPRATVPGQYALLLSQNAVTSCQILVQGTVTPNPGGADIVGSAAVSVQERTPPCPGAIFVRVVSTTTECVERKVIFVSTLEWMCSDGTIQTTTERVQTETPC